MRAAPAILLALLPACSLATGCTGLVAGPEVAATTAVPAPRDSAYARARRGLSGEVFTMDVVDSSKGHLTGTRFPSKDARQGSTDICRVVLAMDISGDAKESVVRTSSRWVAPEEMAVKEPGICEENRQEVVDRLAQALVPPAQ